MEIVSKPARKEIIGALRLRYRLAPKLDKGQILNEFIALSGYHRKHAIRLMNCRAEPAKDPIIRGTRVYDEAVKSALVLIWEAADRICGKRLKAAIPTLIQAMERHKHLELDPEVRKRLERVSAATIDRILKPVRALAGHRRRRPRKPKHVAKNIPIKKFSDWIDAAPGFLEIDFVVHGGGSMAGEYLHSLVATDVCSGWVEAVALLAREQNLVVEGLDRIWAQLPVSVRGIDSDNDGAFINDTLAEYCETRGVEFTRCRPHQKNDQAWVEQKNGAVIRRMVGHERYSGLVAGQALAQLLQVVRLYVNYFQPSFKLRERVREAGKVKKQYHAPATPCDRLLSREDVSEKTKESLRSQRELLDPVELLHRIRQFQTALAALSRGESSLGPDRKSLNEFMAALPEMWRLGEVRPTHRKPEGVPHYWRTREDPFKDVWAEVLLWLQQEPDATAKGLLERLIERDPQRYGMKFLRTLQRRVSEWRRTMASRLVLGNQEGSEEVRAIAPAAPTTGQAALSSRGGRLHSRPSLRTGLAGHASGSLDGSSMSKQRELRL